MKPIFFGSVQESVRDPDLNRVWPGRCQAARRRRRCGNVNPRLMRVSKRRGMSCLGLSTVDPARHFHSELTDSAHFGERRASGTPHEQKRHFPKSRVDWSFLQIVEQSLFFNIHLKSYALLIKSRRGTHTGAVFFVVDG